METRRVKKDVWSNANIAGKEFIVDTKVTATLTMDKVFQLAQESNIACRDFIDRRPDIVQAMNVSFDPLISPERKESIRNRVRNIKVLYGHIGGFGYVVTEDELETEDIAIVELMNELTESFSNAMNVISETFAKMTEIAGANNEKDKK